MCVTDFREGGFSTLSPSPKKPILDRVKPDLTKQTIEICFSIKNVNNNPKPLSFNQYQAKIYEGYKHLDLILDTKLTFKEHF